ncbi:hypothetical protein PENSPDRAFT_456492 [Peniophora sp. CONT]|nr:hypothetical protein PENSPDRAFT_456492 [Peniophora sp. CONT]
MIRPIVVIIMDDLAACYAEGSTTSSTENPSSGTARPALASQSTHPEAASLDSTREPEVVSPADVFPILTEGLRESGSSDENLYRFSSLWTGISQSSEPVQLNMGSIGAYEYRMFDESSEPLNEDDVAELDQQMLQPDDSDEAGRASESALPLPGSRTYPFPSKALFLTQALFSSPQVRFSEPQKRAVLDWAEAMHTPNVPTMHALDKCEQKIQSLLGSPTERVSCPQTGSVLYRNGLDHAIARDFSNPITRQSMIEYSVDRGKASSQVHDAEKLLSKSPENTQPCVRVLGKIFYVGELLKTKGGEYFIPERFFYASPDEHPADADPRTWDIYSLGWAVSSTEAGFIVHDEHGHVPFNTSDFVSTFKDLCAKLPEGASPAFAPRSAQYASQMPHKWRALAGERMVYTVPIISFIDDVSANISKQWNKNHVAYASNALLPREMLDKAFNIYFVSSSPTASPAEIANAVKMSLEESRRNGVVAYDCMYGEEVLLFPYLLCKAGDNPMLAELSSHGGLRCNHPCRTCDVGGTTVHKQSAEGYSDLFKEGKERTPEETKDEIIRQLKYATRVGGNASIERSVKATGVHDAASQALVDRLVKLGRDCLGSSRVASANKRAAEDTSTPVASGWDGERVTGQADEDDDPSEFDSLTKEEIEDKLLRELEKCILDDEINPLLGIAGFNVHKDTPTEILHTILLGVVKYFWGQTMFILKQSSNAQQLAMFRARLHSLGDDGLNLPLHLSADYLCQFSGSLIGKHMKSLAQVMPFLVCDLVDEKLLHAWNVIGSLVVLLWHTAIDDKELYLAELSRTIDDFLHLAAQCAPSILITKPKFHFLVHLPAFIRRFGPAILFSTERYESFNRIFRLTCIYSNRRAPSRDSCRAFAAFDTMKHILSGGYWRDQRVPAPGEWVHAGPDVSAYLDKHPKIKSLLNLPCPSDKTDCTGDMRLLKPSLPRTSNSTASKVSRAPPPPPIPWKDTAASNSCERSEHILPVSSTDLFFKGSAVRLLEGDIARPDATSLVQLTSENETGLRFAKIIELLSTAAERHSVSHVTIQLYRFLDTLHPKLDLPCLQLTSEKKVVDLKSIQCIVNVQHDCERGGCNSVTRGVAIRQDYEISAKTRQVLVHKNLDFVVLNTHSLHNHRLIARATPSHLTRAHSYANQHDNVVHTAVRHMATAKRKKKGNTMDDEAGAPAIAEDEMGEASSLPLFDRHSKAQAKGKAAVKDSASKKRKRDADDERDAVADVVGIETTHTLEERLQGPARGPNALTIVALDEQLNWHRVYGSAPDTLIPEKKSARGSRSARIAMLREAVIMHESKPDARGEYASGSASAGDAG